MNNYRFLPVFVALFFLFACTALEEPLTEADCFDDEYYDAVDEMCYAIEDEDDAVATADEGSEENMESNEPQFEENEDGGESEGVMSAADCYEDEYFDEADQQCYLNEDAFDDEAGGSLGSWLGSLGEEILESNVDFSDGSDGEDGVIVHYTIRGDQIVDPQSGSVEGETALEILEDEASHLALWAQFAELIPPQQRVDITRFGIFTDGAEETLAYVEPNPEDPTTWIIVLDPADAVNQDDFTLTLIHEFGHVLTLNDRQVPFDEAAYFDESGESYEAAVDACPTFFTGEGCALSNAYIHAFFSAFWEDIYEELPFPDEDGVVDEDELYAFYETYADSFVTEYAATNPGEDIAESWTYFVLKPKPAGDTVAERKILFFYDYPELVALRQEILSRLYAQSRR